VADVELAVEGHVDAVRGEGGVEVDDELGVLLGAQLEVVLVQAERRLGHEPELGVERRVGGDRHVDADFGGLAVLGPDLVELDDRLVELDQRVDEVGLDLGFVGQFVVALVFDLGLAVEPLVEQALFGRLGLDREVDARPRLERERLGLDFEREERVFHLEPLALEFAFVDLD